LVNEIKAPMFSPTLGRFCMTRV